MNLVCIIRVWNKNSFEKTSQHEVQIPAQTYSDSRNINAWVAEHVANWLKEYMPYASPVNFNYEIEIAGYGKD